MKKGWRLKQLGDVCTIVNGGTPKTRIPEYWDGDHLWITPAEMGKRSSPYVADTERKITDLGLRDSSAKMLPAGSVILSSRAPIGYLVINTEPMATNQGCKGIIPGDQLKDKFLYYYLGSIVDVLNLLGTGATFKELSGGKLKTITVPVPPLPEQQRIVALLDEAFDGLATAKANAEQNLANARALFESHLDAVFRQRGEGWVEHKKSLAELCELIVDCEHKTAPTQEQGTPSIRTPNIGKGKLLLDGVYRVSEETYRKWTRRAEPLPGDLILAREAPAGNVAVIPENLKVCLGQRTVLIRPNRKFLEPEFLALLLLWPQMQQRLLAHSRGATVEHVNMKDIRALDVGGIPPLSLQRDIASVVGAVTEESERLEAIYQRKLAALDELKQSLLHRAFHGEL
ncbi:MAG: restriction endonuclease subunit S [Caldilineaceae bacterium]|nr:restriction endonuclease subunit S [Caldilineaceae bacterium]